MEDVKDGFGDVKRADGAPVVLSRYGFKKILFEGEYYLSPLSEEEHVVGLANVEGVSAETIRNRMNSDKASCYYKSIPEGCVSNDGCPYCRPVALGPGMGWTCSCGY